MYCQRFNIFPTKHDSIQSTKKQHTNLLPCNVQKFLKFLFANVH